MGQGILGNAVQGVSLNRLAEPFEPEDVRWMLLRVDEQANLAFVRPYLVQEALQARLDEVAGPAGWSLRYSQFHGGIACELRVGEAVRSAVADYGHGRSDQECSHLAFALAAQLFGMRPPLDADREYEAQYDPDERQFLPPESLPEQPDQLQGSPEGTASQAVAPAARQPGEGQERPKPEGQQVIDRLVDRLKEEGKGLEAARLLVRYGGYGSDPEVARELYRNLRGLLTGTAGSSNA